MKYLSILVILIITSSTVIGQDIMVHRSYNSSCTINLFEYKTESINSININGSIILESDNSLVRILLHGKNQEGILLFEAFYPLFLPGDTIKIDYIEESTKVYNITPDSIEMQIYNSTLVLKSIKMGSEPKSQKTFESIRNTEKAVLNHKIQRLNKNLRDEGYLWLAGENYYSTLPYSKRKKEFGRNTNTFGVEYYVAGIFSTKPYRQGKYKKNGINPSSSDASIKEDESEETSFTKSIQVPDSFFAENMELGKKIPEFDWRERHDAHMDNSQYFDGNPDADETGNGWLTSVKNQSEGNNYVSGCWIFAPLGAAEAKINLFYNQHLDIDLSEQHVLSCTPVSGDPQWTVRFLRDSGLYTEHCFPWQAYDCPCDTAAKCTNPDTVIKIGSYQTIDLKGDTDEQIKAAILNYGPGSATVGYHTWSNYPLVDSGFHAMCLMGYGIVRAGDLLWRRGEYGVEENYYVSDTSSLIGVNYWIFKNAATTSSGVDGYRYYIIDTVDNWFEKYYSPMNPYNSVGTNFSVSCLDLDGDGYYNWGTGSKPVHCPPCPTEPDGNDNDPTIGPINSDGYLSYTFPYFETFEENIITWFQDKNDNFDWTLNSGSTPSSYTGPASAYGGSNYIYTEASGANYPSKRASIISPYISLVSVCSPKLEFKYHMYGSGMGSLKVYVSTDDGDTWSSALWTKSGNQGNSWQSASVSLSSYIGEQVLVKFEVITGTSYTSDVAIDNVQVVSGTSSGEIYIDSNTTWSDNRTVCDDVFVEYGAKLTITGTVYMGTSCMINVSTSSTLEIDGGRIINGDISISSSSTLSIKNDGGILLRSADDISIDSNSTLDITSGGLSVTNE